MDAIAQWLLDFLSTHIGQEKAVITGAPVALAIFVGSAALLAWFVRGRMDRQIIKVHKERHKLKDEQLADLKTKVTTPVNSPSTEEVSRERQPDSRLFVELGINLGKLHNGFDAEYLEAAHKQCEMLGLMFSAAKLDRVVKLWNRDYDRMMEDGGTVSDETIQVLKFQMDEIEDAVRSDIARLKTDLTPTTKWV